MGYSEDPRLGEEKRCFRGYRQGVDQWEIISGVFQNVSERFHAKQKNPPSLFGSRRLLEIQESRVYTGIFVFGKVFIFEGIHEMSIDGKSIQECSRMFEDFLYAELGSRMESILCPLAFRD